MSLDILKNYFLVKNCKNMFDFIKSINSSIHYELPRSITHNNRYEDESKRLGKKQLKYDISFHSMSKDKAYAYTEDGMLVTTGSSDKLPEKNNLLILVV